MDTALETFAPTGVTPDMSNRARRTPSLDVRIYLPDSRYTLDDRYRFAVHPMNPNDGQMVTDVHSMPLLAGVLDLHEGDPVSFAEDVTADGMWVTFDDAPAWLQHIVSTGLGL